MSSRAPPFHARLSLPQYQIKLLQPTRNKKTRMAHFSMALIAMVLFFLASLPSSAAFSASLKAQGNETNVSNDYNLTSHDSKAEMPTEVGIWTEALSSPKVLEPGNSFILQVQMQGQRNVGLAGLQDAFNGIDNLTKKNLTDFCEYGLYFVDITERWADKLDPADLNEKLRIYLDKESGKGLNNALHDISTAALDAMMKNPKRMERFLSEEDAALLQKDPKAFGDKRKLEIKASVEAWLPIFSNEQFSVFVDVLKDMKAAELHDILKEALRETESLLKDMQKLNPKSRNFDIKLVRCVLKYFLPPQEYAEISKYIPLMVKQFRNAQNAHNPLIAAM